MTTEGNRIEDGVRERIIQHLSPAAQERTVYRVQVGLIYSAVQLDTGAVGVAYTFPESRECRAENGGERRPLVGRKASILLSGLEGKDLLASALGLATANALLASRPPSPHMRDGDVLEGLQLRSGDRVCMVGCFVPLLKSLQARQISVTAVDQVPKPESLPAHEAEHHLPRSQVAIITATSLINGTLDHLLELSRCCREVALLGPSTPLLPEAFFGTPVTCLAGIRVREPEAVLQSIAEGQGFRLFKRYVRKVNIPMAGP
jgi:uncharacterized protein (DUF4213/DUF364 family)